MKSNYQLFITLCGLLLGTAAGCDSDGKSGGAGSDDGAEAPREGTNPGECTDGADNDADGQYDCNDSDCAASPDCSELNTPGGCTDGLDNDGDGRIDCDDPDCAGSDDCPEDGDGTGSDTAEDSGSGSGDDSSSGVEDCSDGDDNDGDGDIDCEDADCADDPDCAPPADPLGTPGNPATSCREIRDEAIFDADGVYWLNPDGAGAFEVYCSMNLEDGGWALLSNLGPCSSSTNVATVTDTTTCSLLSAERVNRIASAADEVMLRAGPTFSELTEFTLSQDSAAIEALRTPSGTWHNGAVWSDWNWTTPECGVESVTGWPLMFLGCGHDDGVHWVVQGDNRYIHSRTNNSGFGTGEVATTWVR